LLKKVSSLLPPGEGQDEGIIKITRKRVFDPLTPTLSRREREFFSNLLGGAAGLYRPVRVFSCRTHYGIFQRSSGCIPVD